MSLMLAPKPLTTYVVSSGKNYNSDVNSLIYDVSAGQDQLDLQSAGAIVLQPPPSNLIGKLLGANFNVTTDQSIAMLINAKYRVTKITVENASISLTTAAGGLYTQASKAGTPLVTSAQVYTALTASNIALDLTLNEPNAVQASTPTLTPIYFSLTTAQGAAATADIFVFGDIYPAT